LESSGLSAWLCAISFVALSSLLNAENFAVMAAHGTTMIKFLTDGVLLREMMDDPLFVSSVLLL
jgi:hypothetical protein